MHLNAKRPVFVPEEFQGEIEKLSKAALMDAVWGFAARCAGTDDHAAIMAEVRKTAEIVVTHRKLAA